jgi:hypothetical protein
MDIFDADEIADLVLPHRLRRIVARLAVLALVVVPGAQPWVLRQARSKIERETRMFMARLTLKTPPILTASVPFQRSSLMRSG